MNASDEEVVETYPELDPELEAAPAEEDARPVSSQPHDWTISTLRDKYDRGQIDLRPGYQRGFVWALKPELPPRLIESILLEIPIPPVYLGKLPGGRMDVIDGQQRLTTLFRFVTNELRIQKLQRLPSLNGKFFRDLSDEMQSQILDAPIRSIVIDTGSNDTLRYEVFERLNRGSMALTEQEIRNAVYRGSFNEMLGRLEGSSEWRNVKGGDEPDPRFIEREMILRFFAFASRIDYYKGNLKRFLNDYMGTYAPKDLGQVTHIEAMFRQTMKNVYAVFGEHSGRLYTAGTEDRPSVDGKWDSKFSISALDIQASALIGHDPAKVQQAAEQIREAYIFYLLTNSQVRLAISRQPAGTSATRTRWYDFKAEVQKLLNSFQIEPRFFSYAFRRQLYADSPVCKLCGNEIHTFEDSTVDHKMPYSKGGKTVPENGQLAHRSCNAKKCANLPIVGISVSLSAPELLITDVQPDIEVTAWSRRDRSVKNQRVVRELDREKPYTLYDDFTYTRPFGFKLEGQIHRDVPNWTVMYELICRQIAQKDPRRFEQLPTNPSFTSTRGRREFSTSRAALHRAVPIGNGIYVEGNHSANDMMNKIKDLLAEFSIPPTALTIYLREGPDAE